MDHIPNRPTYVRQALIKTVRALAHEVTAIEVWAKSVQAGDVNRQGAPLPCLGTGVLLMDRLNLWDLSEMAPGPAEMKLLTDLKTLLVTKEVSKGDIPKAAEIFAAAVNRMLNVNPGLRIN